MLIIDSQMSGKLVSAQEICFKMVSTKLRKAHFLTTAVKSRNKAAIKGRNKDKKQIKKATNQENAVPAVFLPGRRLFYSANILKPSRQYQ